jgi:branched-chain amino acid transport system ATP-binding protein
MILEVEKIHTFYGWSHILFDISLGIEERETVAILGRNGAGKTTAFRSIMGLTPPKVGEVRYKGEIISGQRPYMIARKGIGYVPSGHKVFGDLTVVENLLVGTKKAFKSGLLPRTPEEIYNLFPILGQRRKQRAGTLSGGERQMLTIARTLMGNPEVLILDEPSTGLSPLVINNLGEKIHQLKGEGLSILLAEQNAKFGMALCERCYIIDKGEIRYQGLTLELQQNQELMQMYLAV